MTIPSASDILFVTLSITETPVNDMTESIQQKMHELVPLFTERRDPAPCLSVIEVKKWLE